MHHDPDDEDWYDDVDDGSFDDEESARCPECGGAIHSVAERCPACGYWLTEADRRTLRFDISQPLWIKATAIIVLVTFLASLLGLAAAVF